MKSDTNVFIFQIVPKDMHYLIRYGEIGLKGLNRPFFENKLVENIRLISNEKEARITRKRGRIIVESEKDISESLKKVFGIVSFSIAEKVRFERLNEKIIEMVKNKEFETFRITASRLKKEYPKDSNQIAEEIGDSVREKLNKKVDLENFDLNIQIEIIDSAYVFFEKTECLGGLPVSTEGKVAVLLETERGIEAAIRMMKRGCDVVPFAFNDFDISEINQYMPNKREITKIRNIKEIEDIAKEKEAKALAVEDSFDDLKDYDVDLAVLRPVVFG